MRTTLSIDDDVLEDARYIARVEGKSLGDVISALARRSLAPARIAVRSSVDDLPRFDVPDDAPRIRHDDVARAMDDE